MQHLGVFEVQCGGNFVSLFTTSVEYEFSFLIYSASRKFVGFHNSLYKIVLKLHKSSSSIGFILKCLFKKVTPQFVKVKGQFLRKANIWEAGKAILKSRLSSHYQDLHEQCNLLQNQCSSLTNKTSAIYTKFVLNRIQINQRHFRTELFPDHINDNLYRAQQILNFEAEIDKVYKECTNQDTLLTS